MCRSVENNGTPISLAPACETSWYYDESSKLKRPEDTASTLLRFPKTEVSLRQKDPIVSAPVSRTMVQIFCLGEKQNIKQRALNIFWEQFTVSKGTDFIFNSMWRSSTLRTFSKIMGIILKGNFKENDISLAIF